MPHKEFNPLQGDRKGSLGFNFELTHDPMEEPVPQASSSHEVLPPEDQDIQVGDPIGTSSPDKPIRRADSPASGGKPSDKIVEQGEGV
jgi:hypothetical protein